MMKTGIWSAALGSVLLLLGHLAAGAAAGEAATCPPASAADAILGLPGGTCPAVEYPAIAAGPIGVVEGDEGALQRALNLVHRNRDDYVAVLFYASWCPFSKLCQPNFNTMSSMFPSIRHFAFEESVIRPSILSRYGVHGFPTLFLLNSTMRVRYHGSRSINSFLAFYSDVTGVMPASLNLVSVDGIIDQVDATDPKQGIEPENCPFSWARSPEKLLQQDTYLALASFFVLIRLLYIFLPKLNACVKRAWRRHMRYTSLMSFGDLSLAYLQQARQGLYRLNLCKSRNLQEGAMNATAWASTSLASVTMGEPSSGRAHSAAESR